LAIRHDFWKAPMTETLYQIPVSQQEIDQINSVYEKYGEKFRFIGIVLGDDDWYFIMSNTQSGKQHWLSCVGTIENFEYELVSRP